MSRIFISYRRVDSKTVTSRINKALVKEYGKDRVWRDIEDIRPGEDFREAIARAISRCDIVLVVIGQLWTKVRSDDGSFRLDDPDDIVRIEVELALARPNTKVIPVLVNGAEMPRSGDVPQALEPLLYKNAVQVREDPDFEIDLIRLTGVINEFQPRGMSRVQMGIIAGFILLVVIGGGLATYVFYDQQNNTPPPINPTEIVEANPDLEDWERFVGNGMTMWLPDSWEPSTVSFRDSDFRQLMLNSGVDELTLNRMMVNPPTLRLAAFGDGGQSTSNHVENVVILSEYVPMISLNAYVDLSLQNIPASTRIVEQRTETIGEREYFIAELRQFDVRQYLYIFRSGGHLYTATFSSARTDNITPFERMVEEAMETLETF